MNNAPADIPAFPLNAETSIPVSVETSRSRRSGYSIHFDPRGLRVLVPPGTKKDEALKHLERHRRWIANRFRERRAAENALPEMKDGAQVPLKGGFRIVQMADKDIPEGTFTDTAFIYPPSAAGNAEKTALHLADAYIDEAWKHILGRLAKPEFAEFLPRLREIRLKEIKSRWGSCSAKGGVSISWRPIMAPTEVMDYLLIHELCHLLIQGHNQKFWAEVEKRCPDYRAAKRYLRTKHFELTNFPIPLGAPLTFRRMRTR